MLVTPEMSHEERSELKEEAPLNMDCMSSHGRDVPGAEIGVEGGRGAEHELHVSHGRGRPRS